MSFASVYKYLTEFPYPIFYGLGLVLDKVSGGIARTFWDGNALQWAAYDPSLSSPPDALAPFGIQPQPRIAHDANVPALQGLPVLQGVQTADGDLVLLVNQNTPAQNGPWQLHANDASGNATAWTRPLLPIYGGQLNFIEAGTYPGKTFRLNTTGPITVGTTALTYDQLGTAGAVLGGVVTVNNAQSPYAIQSTDRIILVDTTGGPVTLTEPAAPSLGQQQQVVDAKRNFGANNCTIDGNGKNVGAAGMLILNAAGTGGILTYTGTLWDVR